LTQLEVTIYSPTSTGVYSATCPSSLVPEGLRNPRTPFRAHLSTLLRGLTHAGTMPIDADVSSSRVLRLVLPEGCGDKTLMRNEPQGSGRLVYTAYTASGLPATGTSAGIGPRCGLGGEPRGGARGPDAADQPRPHLRERSRAAPGHHSWRRAAPTRHRGLVPQSRADPQTERFNQCMTCFLMRRSHRRLAPVSDEHSCASSASLICAAVLSAVCPAKFLMHMRTQWRCVLHSEGLRVKHNVCAILTPLASLHGRWRECSSPC